MKVHQVQQGSREWHEFRARHRTASDAPAMMGVSPYKTRNELLAEKFSGIAPEPTEAQQRIFDKGHVAEAKARPIAEELVGAELFPVTGSQADSLFGASFDGLTMDGSIAWEHKLWNDDKAESVKAGKVPETDWYQVQQQLMVSGAKWLLYMVSDGTHDGCASMKVYPDREAWDQIRRGWTRFEDDLADFKPDTTVQATAAPIDALPALLVEIEGAVKSTNLATYKDVVTARIAAINTDLQTDQDFADAEQMVKFLNEAEKDLDAVKARALAQTASIDELFRAIDSIRDGARTKRLELDKLVKARKEAVRYEIKAEAEGKLADHLATINATLGGKIKVEAAAVNPQFAAVMKGKKTVTSLRSACDDELARCKIAASEIADRIRGNLEILRTEAEGYERLFRDAQAIVMKEPDDLRNLVAARIAEHKAEEQRVAEEAARKERERIEREQAEKERREKAEAERLEREQAAAAKRAEQDRIDAERKAAAATMAEGARNAQAPQEVEPPKVTIPTASEGGPTRMSIVRLVADAYGLSEQAAEIAIINIFKQREAA